MSDTRMNDGDRAAPAAAAARRRWVLAAVAGVAAAAGIGVAWRRFEPEPPPDADGFWTARFQTLNGDALSIGALRGKPLLVNFWATWCPPCVEEMPLLSRFYTEHRAKGWQVLGLAVDQAEPVKRFLARAPVSFPIALAGLDGVDVSRSLGNTAGGLPFTVVFGADGRIRQQKIGQVRESELRAWVG